MNDVFISYARENRSTADLLSQQLEHEGFSVWWDHSLNPGEAFRATIEEQLQKAKFVIVLWSRDSVKSHFVIDEASRAQQRGVLVPILIDRLDTRQLPLGFGGTHVLDLSNWRGDANHIDYSKLLNSMANRAGSRSSDATEASTSIEEMSLTNPAKGRALDKLSHLTDWSQREASLSSRHFNTPKPRLFMIPFFSGLGIFSWLLLVARQDWNLWLAVSIPAMLFGLSGYIFARQSSKLAVLLLVISLILGTVIFATAPG